MQLSITPFNPVIGARVDNFSLTGNLDKKSLDAIKAALAAHLVLVFPDQHLSVSELMNLCKSHERPV